MKGNNSLRCYSWLQIRFTITLLWIGKFNDAFYIARAGLSNCWISLAYDLSDLLWFSILLHLHQWSKFIACYRNLSNRSDEWLHTRSFVLIVFVHWFRFKISNCLMNFLNCSINTLNVSIIVLMLSLHRSFLFNNDILYNVIGSFIIHFTVTLFGQGKVLLTATLECAFWCLPYVIQYYLNSKALF